jgi:hypothetical protein
MQRDSVEKIKITIGDCPMSWASSIGIAPFLLDDVHLTMRTLLVLYVDNECHQHQMFT